MIKHVLVSAFLLLLIAMLIACGPVIPGNGNYQEQQTPSPIATENVFVVTKFAGMTNEAETQIALRPKNGATVTAILATKYTGATQAAQTMTAQPTETPTLAIPSDSPLCTPTDLKTSYDSIGGTGNVFMNVVFINTSNKPCYLQAWPQAILLDGPQGKPLDVDYSYQDISASELTSVATEELGLWPGWETWFTFIWFDYRTWCGAPVTSNLVIRLTLMSNSGTVEVPTDFQPGTACDTPGSRTSVSITRMELIPSATSSLDQITMFDENQGWLIGGENYADRRVFHTEDGGITWEDVTPDGIAYIVDGGIDFLDSQIAWIPSTTKDTSIPTIYHTTDGGKTWSKYQYLPFKQAGLDFSDSKIGWATADIGVAAGNLYFTLYQSVDGGVSWTQVMLGPPFRAIEPSLPRGTIHIADGQNFKFLDSNTIWFGGNQIVSLHNVVLQVSHDGGKTWQEKTISVPQSDKIENGMVLSGTPVFITENDGYVVASYPISGHGSTRDVSDVIMTHDGGKTWTASPNLIEGETDWTLQIDFVSPTDAFFHCGDSLCVTHDSAQTWTTIPSNINFTPTPDQPTLVALDFVNLQVGWAIVYQNGQTQLIKTTDGGRTWKSLPH